MSFRAASGIEGGVSCRSRALTRAKRTYLVRSRVREVAAGPGKNAAMQGQLPPHAEKVSQPKVTMCGLSQHCALHLPSKSPQESPLGPILTRNIQEN